MRSKIILRHNYSAGFTLVELIIVISVIGILAAVGFVNYNGWNKATNVAQLKSDLNGISAAMENARNFGSGYPSDVSTLTSFTKSDGVTLSGGSTDGGKTYCVNAISSQNPSLSYHVDNVNGVQLGVCNTGLSAPVNLSYTGSYQDYIVPAGVSTITMEAWGAQGGGSSGGLGGYTKAKVTVTPGETLRTYIGGQGATGTCSNTAFCATGGYNGGGNAQSSDISSTQYGGGGASDIRRSPYTLSDRLIVAGGGGSQGGLYSTWHPGGGGSGGQTGQNGGACPDCSGSPLGTAGGGATQSIGGSAGTAGNYGGYVGGTGNGGSLGQGAAGVGCWWTGSGAGGGGYYGGGSAGCPGSHGGGGGSSWAMPSSTNVVYTTGLRNGNGQVVLSS